MSRTSLPAALCACWLLGSLASPGCARQAPAIVELPPPVVTVAKPVRREVTEHVDFTGRTVAVEEVKLYARVAGYMDKVNFKDGEEVEEGALLFQIDPRPFKATVAQAEAEIDRWKAGLKKAKNDLKRYEKLVESKNVTKEKIDETIAERDQNEASLHQSEATLEKAQIDLAFTKITAPIAGRLSDTTATIGNLVSAGGAGPPLTTLVRLDEMHVYFNVDERTMLRYQELARAEGMEVRLEHIRKRNIPAYVGLATEKGHPHIGVLDFADNQVSAATGTIRVRAVLNNKERSLTPGLFVRVQLPFGNPRQALLVDETALGTFQGRKYVYVVQPDKTARQQFVEVGPEFEGQREVLSGLQGDETIIVNGLQRARDGRPVDPRQQAAKTEPEQTAGADSTSSESQ